MEMPGFAQKLAAALMSRRAEDVPVGQGMVQQGQQALAGRAYQLHQQEMAAMGQQPLGPQEFQAQQMQGGAPQMLGR